MLSIDDSVRNIDAGRSHFGEKTEQKKTQPKTVAVFIDGILIIDFQPVLFGNDMKNLTQLVAFLQGHSPGNHDDSESFDDPDDFLAIRQRGQSHFQNGMEKIESEQQVEE